MEINIFNFIRFNLISIVVITLLFFSSIVLSAQNTEIFRQGALNYKLNTLLQEGNTDTITQGLYQSFKKNKQTESYNQLVEEGLALVDRLQEVNEDDYSAIMVAKAVLEKAIQASDSLNIANLNYEIGESYSNLENNLECIHHLHNALTYLDVSKHHEEIFDVYYLLGRSAVSVDINKSITYLRKAERYVDFQTETKRNDLYLELIATLPSHPLDSVLPYFRILEEHHDFGSNIYDLLSFYNNLAYTYYENKMYSKAKTVLNENLDWCSVKNKFADCEDIVFYEFIHTIGLIEKALGNYQYAEYCLNRAIKEAGEDKNYKDLGDFLLDKADLYKEQGDFKKSYETMVIHKKYIDSISRIDIEKEIQRRENLRLLNKSKSKILSLKKENIEKDIKINYFVFYGSILLFLFLLILIFFVFLYGKSKIIQSKLQNEVLSNKLNRLTLAMNPHFLFNCFSTLQNLILKQNIFKANAYMASLATLIRGIFESAEEVYTLFSRELDLIDSYCKLEAINQLDDFIYRIEIDENLKQNDFSIPSMIIQPFIENAFKHGFEQNKNNNSLLIAFKETDHKDVIQCIVEDNGRGRSKTVKKESGDTLGLATFNIHRRLEVINFQRKKQASFEIIDLVNEHSGEPRGTKVIINLPIEI